jgi:hypothetical protein
MEITNLEKLYPDIKKYQKNKKVLFRKHCKLDRASKQSAAAIALHKARGNGKEAKQAVIYDTIEYLMQQNKLITKPAIEDLTGIKQDSIRRYWKPFKEIIEQHNISLTALTTVPLVTITDVPKYNASTVTYTKEETMLESFLLEIDRQWFSKIIRFVN